MKKKPGLSTAPPPGQEESKTKEEAINAGELTIKEMIIKVEQLVQENKLNQATKLYKELQTVYLLMPKEEKKQHYQEIHKIISLIKQKAKK